MAEGSGAGYEGGDGVLLYYKYAPVPDLTALSRFYDSNCRALGLLGRVRIAPDGVNVTIGGKMSSLEKHIAAARSDSLFDGTDFKLASCDHPSDDRIAKECGFTSLSIRVVKELVTFRADPLLKSPVISNAGRHLSASEFHSVIHNAGNTLDAEASMQHKELLLLDARNVYETRIGKFQSPNVETLDPGIRQYSDLPTWIDKHSEQLRNKCILMIVDSLDIDYDDSHFVATNPHNQIQALGELCKLQSDFLEKKLLSLRHPKNSIRTPDGVNQ